MGIANSKLEVVRGSRNVRLVWTSDGVRCSAEIARVGDVPKMVSYTVACEHGIPVDGRQMPTEAAVIGAIRDLGESAVPYLAYVMEASIHGEGTLASITEERIRAGLQNFQRDLFRRPHSRRPELVGEARRLLNNGARTTDVVNALVSQGVSPATAYRYVQRATTPERHRASTE
jgi:hypothetical protein